MTADYIINRMQTTIKLHGDLDEYGAGQIKRELDDFLLSHPARVFVFDMADVPFVDSTGLGFLLARYKKLKAVKAELVVKNVSKQVDKVFKTSGVYSFIPKID